MLTLHRNHHHSLPITASLITAPSHSSLITASQPLTSQPHHSSSHHHSSSSQLRLSIQVVTYTSAQPLVTAIIKGTPSSKTTSQPLIAAIITPHQSCQVVSSSVLYITAPHRSLPLHHSLHCAANAIQVKFTSQKHHTAPSYHSSLTASLIISSQHSLLSSPALSSRSSPSRPSRMLSSVIYITAPHQP
jgi:hypothetical protein